MDKTDAGYKMHDAGCEMHDAGCEMQDAGCEMQDAGCEMQDAEVSMQDVELLASFFAQHTVEVEDRGFTQRVMRRLPDRQLQLNRIWTAVCAVAAVAVFILTKGWLSILGAFHGLASDLVTTLPQVNFITAFATVVMLTALTGYSLVTSER